MIHPLLKFQYRSYFNHFLWGRNKYNDMEKIMKLVDMVYERGGGWDREWSTKQNYFLLVSLEVF